MRFKTPKLNKKIKILFPVLAILAFSFIFANPAQANWASDVVGGIISLIISALGLILILVIKGLLIIASYQEFIGSPAVTQGWVIVRDFSNMFFVVVLLVIAFATILHIEEYNYKKWLPKLILMAILINFSKTICGLLIDVAQIVMLTFVNAFKDIAGGNFIEMLGIKEIVTLSEANPEMSAWTVVGAYVLGLIYMIIALVVITTMMMILAMRLVMIWIYVVLSPLAYLLSAFPGGAKYASKWWQDFISNLIVGPVLAFFIWLSFAALQTGSNAIINNSANESISSEAQQTIGYEQPLAASEASTPGVLIKFVIGIGMLIGGLKIAQEIGGAAGSIAGKGMNKLNAMGSATAGFGKKWAGKIASGDNLAARKFTKAVGFDARPMAVAAAIKSSYSKAKKDDESAIRQKGISNLEKGGMSAVLGGVGAGQDWANNYTSGFLGTKGIANAFKESFIRPTKRKNLKTDLEAEEEEVKALKKERNRYTTTEQYNADKQNIDNSKQKVSDIDQQIATINQRIRSGQVQAGDNEKLKKLVSQKQLISDDITKKENDLNSKVVDNDKHKELSEKINNKEDNISKTKQRLFQVAAPKALEGRGEYRKTINERKDKYKDVTNSDELLQLFEDAVRRNDKFDQIAVVEKLANDGNLNEVLNARGYSANSKGMYDFLHNNANDKGETRGINANLSNKELLQFQGDLSEAAERSGHWEMAKTVGMNSKGELESLVHYETDDQGNKIWNDDKHVIAAASEVAKMDPQKQVISLARLAYGGENADGNFQLSNLGRVLAKMLDQSGAYVDQKSRINQNIAINLSQPGIREELLQLGIRDSVFDAFNARGGSSMKPAEALEDVQATLNLLRNMNNNP